jgi:hypothetical protein
MIVLARRASAILYNLLRSRQDPRPFLLPANVCPIVHEVLEAAAQAFQLIDLEEPSLEIDHHACIEQLRARPGGFAGLLFVRPYGSERDPTAFLAALKEVQRDLFIIDDKCLCRPDPAGHHLSAAADVTLFSTGRAKYADIGGGGFAHLSDSVPYRSTFDDPAPAWVDAGEPDLTWDQYQQRVLAAVELADEQKRTLNRIYSELLPQEIQFLPQFQNWRFHIKVPAADELIRTIFTNGLFASRHYPPLSGGRFPVAEQLHASVVNLFNDRYFDQERARNMVQLILRHMENTRE